MQRRARKATGTNPCKHAVSRLLRSRLIFSVLSLPFLFDPFRSVNSTPPKPLRGGDELTERKGKPLIVKKESEMQNEKNQTKSLGERAPEVSAQMGFKG